MASLRLADMQGSGGHDLLRASRTPGKINLKKVAEALADEGLDPAVEIARVLRGRIVIGADGEPEIDPLTGEVRVTHSIDDDVRLRTLTTLLEFSQPKLKAVEMKVSGSLDLSNDQVEARIAALVAKAAND